MSASGNSAISAHSRNLKAALVLTWFQPLELTETVTGHALACLYAADRYHHIETEIRPAMEEGRTVISDRYIPSGLVMQRFDGIDPAFLCQLNAEADRPDLAVILEADPEVIAERLIERGPHNRFQLSPGGSHAEVHLYRQATERLIQAGFDVPCSTAIRCSPPYAGSSPRRRSNRRRRYSTSTAASNASPSTTTRCAASSATAPSFDPATSSGRRLLSALAGHEISVQIGGLACGIVAGACYGNGNGSAAEGDVDTVARCARTA
jgi:hypothetical protein